MSPLRKVNTGAIWSAIGVAVILTAATALAQYDGLQTDGAGTAERGGDVFVPQAEEPRTDLFGRDVHPRGILVLTLSPEPVDIYVGEMLAARLEQPGKQVKISLPRGSHWVRASFADGADRVIRIDVGEARRFRPNVWVDLWMPVDQVGMIRGSFGRYAMWWLIAGVLAAGPVLAHAACERRHAFLGFGYATLTIFLLPFALIYACTVLLGGRSSARHTAKVPPSLMLILAAGIALVGTPSVTSATKLYLLSEKATYDIYLNDEDEPRIRLGPMGEALDTQFEDLQGETHVRAMPVDAGRPRALSLDLPSQQELEQANATSRSPALSVEDLPALPPSIALIAMLMYAVMGIAACTTVTAHGIRARHQGRDRVGGSLFWWSFGSLLLWWIMTPIYLNRAFPPRAQLVQIQGEMRPIQRISFFLRRVFCGRISARRYAATARSRQQTAEPHSREL